MASAGNIRAGGAFVEIFAQDGKFQQAMTRVQNRLRATGKNLQQFGTGMTLGAAAVGAPMVMALRQFTQYDDAIRAARAVTNSFGKDGEAAFGRMNDKARELGASTSFTAVQVAQLMTELGRAGFKPDQINAMTGAVLDLARATGTDASLAATIAAESLRQFDMNADDATRVADVLTLAANSTNNTLETLGESLKYAGLNAHQAGLSIEETAAILGTLGNVGIKGSMAGTTMRRLLTITAAEGQKLQKIFGVAFHDSAKNARPLVDVLGDVAVATNGLPTGERAKKFSDAFGLLGITGATAIGNLAADTRKLTNELNNATGTARATAKEMDAGLGGSMRILLSAVEGVALAFGDAIAPAAQVMANAATKSAEAIRALVKQFPLASQLAAGTVAGLFALGVAAIVGGFSLKVLASSIGVFTKLLTALASPMGLAAAGVVAGVALMLTAAYQLSPAFRKEADAIMNALSRLDFKAAWDVMNLNLAIALVQMAQAFDNAWAAVKNTVVATASFIGDKLAEGVDRFMTLFGADILTLQAGLEKLGLYFRSAFDFSWATGGLTKALAEVDARIARERAKAGTADERAAQRSAKRQSAADGRQAANDQRNAGYEATIATLRDDLRRARDRANGVVPEPAPAEQKPVQVEVSRPVAVQTAPGVEEPAAVSASGGNTLGTFAADLGSRLAAGPTVTAAERTADATERTAEGVDQLLRADNGVGNANGLGNTDGVGNVMGVGNDAGVLGSSAAVPAAAATAPRQAESPLDGLAVLTEQELTKSFAKAGFADPNLEATSGPVDLAALHAGRAAAAPAPAAPAIPPPDPTAVQRAAASAMPSAAASPVGIERELLSVAERHANLAQQMVAYLQKIVENTGRGALAFG